MRILFCTSPVEDYLAVSLLHGFRTLYGERCVDFPKCEVLYRNCPQETSRQMRGGGFSLFRLLDDLVIDRFHIAEKVEAGFYDLIIISDIWRQFGSFVQYRPWLHKGNCIICDGNDTTQPFGRISVSCSLTLAPGFSRVSVPGT